MTARGLVSLGLAARDRGPLPEDCACPDGTPCVLTDEIACGFAPETWVQTCGAESWISCE